MSELDHVPNIIDFNNAKRQAAIDDEIFRCEMMAESECDYQIDCAERELEEWFERERVKREKYEQVMAEKRGEQHGME